MHIFAPRNSRRVYLALVLVKPIYMLYMKNLKIRTLLLFFIGAFSFLCASAQSVTPPVFQKYVYDDAAIVYGISANGKWALAKSGGSNYGESAPRLIDVSTGVSSNILSSDFEGTACEVNDVTDDGEVVVGSIAGLPAYWKKTPFKEGEFAEQEWILMDMLPNWSGGTITAVTPDGKYGVGMLTGFYGSHEDDEVAASYEYDIAPCLWDLATGKIIETPGLPTRDMTHINQHQNAFVDISPDGRYILGRMDFSYVSPAALFCYVYDCKSATYDVLGFNEHPIDDWTPKADGLHFTEFPVMSANGEWVSGTAYMTKPVEGSQFGLEYRTAFRYNVLTKAFEVFDEDDDKDVYGVAVDNEGVVYGATPSGNPLRDMFIRHGKYWIGLDQICSQYYGVNFFAKTGYSQTGTPIAVNGEGTVINSMIDPRGESFILVAQEPVKNACSSINLLSNYSATPASGSTTASIKSVKIAFNRNVEVLADKSAAAIKGEDGNVIRNSLAFTVDASNSKVVNVAFRTQALEQGKTYTIEIPAGSICIKGDAEKTNNKIVLTYHGRSSAPIAMVEAEPADGSELSMIDQGVSPIIITFDSNVILSDTAYAELYREDLELPICRMTVAYKDNKVAIYPSATQYLYEGHNYRVVLSDSSVVDAGGNCGNREVTLNYKGTYVQRIDANGAVLFSDSFDNISQSLYMWLRYEGDHNTPMSNMGALEFDADNQPWNFSIRESDESGDYCMASHSLYAPSGKSDDWAVIPQIVVPDERCYLSFDAQSYYSTKSDSLSVIIFESEENIGVLTDEVIARFKAEGKRVLYTRLTPGASDEALTGDWQHFEISLAEYAGKKIYIAFVNDNYNQSAIFVDNVLVERNLIYSVALNSDAAVVQQASADIAGAVIVEANDLTFSSIVLKLMDAEGNVLETISESGLSLAEGSTYKFDFKEELPLVVGEENDFAIEVTLDDRVNLTRGSIKNLAFKPTKRVVLEKMTGTTCQFCPGGIIAIEEMKRVAGDQIIPVAIHTYTGDNLSSGLSAYSDFLYLSGAPTGRIDRLPIISSPLWQNNDEDDDDYGMLSFSNKVDGDTWLDLMNWQLGQLTTVDIDIDAQYDAAAGDTISIDVLVKSAINSKNLNYGIFTVVVEDGLTGTQANNYHNNPDPLLGDWGKNGVYGQSAVKGVVYEDVARAVIGTTFNGTPGMIPTDLAANAEYKATISCELPVEVSNWSNAKAVVMLVDNNTGMIVNAAVAKFVDVKVGIEDISSSASVVKTEFFTLGGAAVSAPQRGVNILRQTLSDGSVVVKKILVK